SLPLAALTLVGVAEVVDLVALVSEAHLLDPATIAALILVGIMNVATAGLSVRTGMVVRGEPSLERGQVRAVSGHRLREHRRRGSHAPLPAGDPGAVLPRLRAAPARGERLPEARHQRRRNGRRVQVDAVP